jgi:hypothetical protein
MSEINRIGRGPAHGEAVDLAFELGGEIVATISARRRRSECEQSRGQQRQCRGILRRTAQA